MTKQEAIEQLEHMKEARCLVKKDFIVIDIAIQTLQEQIEREQQPSGWISVKGRMPEAEKIVLVTMKYTNWATLGGLFVSIAAHVGYHECTTEDWRDYEGSTEYDEENDCFWIKPCWYEVNIVDDNPNWELSEDEITVTHWMPLPEPYKEGL